MERLFPRWDQRTQMAPGVPQVPCQRPWEFQRSCAGVARSGSLARNFCLLKAGLSSAPGAGWEKREEMPCPGQLARRRSAHSGPHVLVAYGTQHWSSKALFPLPSVLPDRCKHL